VLSGTIPDEAKLVITKVNIAAKNKDISTLKSFMVSEFVWSFGGDGNAEQAIEAWQAQPSLLRQLQRATSQKCALKPKQYIECPSNTGVGFRAGFKQTTEGWRMVYFVGGD